MTDLPPGWEWTTLGEIADTSLGKMLDKGRSSGRNLVPYLRNINVQWGRFDLDEVLQMEIAPEERSHYMLASDDLLMCEGGEVGRCAVWPGGIPYMAFQKALHRIRPLADISPRFIQHLFRHLRFDGSLQKYATGSTIKHLPQQQLRKIPICLPPLAEQQRIVAELEGHLSRIDAGAAALKANMRRLKALGKRIIVDSVPIPGPAHWTISTVREAGTVDLGRQRHPDWHTGPNMRPYLRVANVFEDRFDLTDVMEMHFEPEVFERFRLRPGEILLNEGQSPEYLGRPAMYRGEPEEIAFTNSLLRFRANPNVDPEWALLVFRRHMHARRFIKEVRITTNIAHLSATRFKSIEFPIPPIEEQQSIVAEVRERLADIDRLGAAVARADRQASALRRSLLTDAFAGRLVPQNPDDEPASVLLERIRAEREARPKPKRTRKSKPAQETLL